MDKADKVRYIAVGYSSKRKENAFLRNWLLKMILRTSIYLRQQSIKLHFAKSITDKKTDRPSKLYSICATEKEDERVIKLLSQTLQTNSMWHKNLQRSFISAYYPGRKGQFSWTLVPKVFFTKGTTFGSSLSLVSKRLYP